jgi:hypothetical protein
VRKYIKKRQHGRDLEGDREAWKEGIQNALRDKKE